MPLLRSACTVHDAFIMTIANRISPRRIVVFVALVVIETAMVVGAIWVATGSWASGTAVGAISGALTASTYPALTRRRRRRAARLSEIPDIAADPDRARV